MHPALEALSWFGYYLAFGLFFSYLTMRYYPKDFVTGGIIPETNLADVFFLRWIAAGFMTLLLLGRLLISTFEIAYQRSKKPINTHFSKIHHRQWGPLGPNSQKESFGALFSCVRDERAYWKWIASCLAMTEQIRGEDDRIKKKPKLYWFLFLTGLPHPKGTSNASRRGVLAMTEDWIPPEYSGGMIETISPSCYGETLVHHSRSVALER